MRLLLLGARLQGQELEDEVLQLEVMYLGAQLVHEVVHLLNEDNELRQEEFGVDRLGLELDLLDLEALLIVLIVKPQLDVFALQRILTQVLDQQVTEGVHLDLWPLAAPKDLQVHEAQQDRQALDAFLDKTTYHPMATVVDLLLVTITCLTLQMTKKDELGRQPDVIREIDIKAR